MKQFQQTRENIYYKLTHEVLKMRCSVSKRRMRGSVAVEYKMAASLAESQHPARRGI